MPVFELLIFIGSFFLLLFAGIYIFLIFYNRRSKSIIDKFFSQAFKFKPASLQSIKLRYWTTNSARTMISPNNYCDLFVTDNFLAIIRTQNFIFKVYFPPVLITSDMTQVKKSFNYLEVYKAELIVFNKIIKDQIDIKLKDPVNKHYKIDITFKELTNEQLDQLEKIRNW